MNLDSYQPASAKRKKSSVLGALFVILFFGACAAAGYFWRYSIRDFFVTQNYSPPAEIAALADSLALTGAGKTIFYASDPILQTKTDFNASACYEERRTSVLGCYYEEKIYIYDSQNDELDGLEESTAAHELLHAIWERQDIFARKALEEELAIFYRQNGSSLNEYMQNYSDEQFYSELHSLAATQFSASVFSDELRAHYQKYFSDLDKLVAYYTSYNEVLQSLNAELDALSAQIEQQKAEIQRKEQKYRSDAEKLNRDIRSFNDNIASSNADLPAQRQRLEERQAQLEADYQLLERLIAQVNQLVVEYNEKAIHHSDLVDSIDSQRNSTQSIE